jgi:L-lactate dehydrogenase complex protein LldG
MICEDMVNLFIENVAKVAAEPVRVSSNEELNGVLKSIFAETDSIFCPAVTEREKIAECPPEKRAESYITASTCVEEVFGAIAETGSLICSSKGGKPIQAGLLAGHHVAIVAAENLYEKLDDFFFSLGDSPPTNITLETGPSRTADIELTLTIGVHGPGRVTVIVFVPKLDA